MTADMNYHQRIIQIYYNNHASALQRLDDLAADLYLAGSLKNWWDKMPLDRPPEPPRG